MICVGGGGSHTLTPPPTHIMNYFHSCKSKIDETLWQCHWGQVQVSWRMIKSHHIMNTIIETDENNISWKFLQYLTLFVGPKIVTFGLMIGLNFRRLEAQWGSSRLTWSFRKVLLSLTKPFSDNHVQFQWTLSLGLFHRQKIKNLVKLWTPCLKDA